MFSRQVLVLGFSNEQETIFQVSTTVYVRWLLTHKTATSNRQLISLDQRRKTRIWNKTIEKRKKDMNVPVSTTSLRHTT